MMKLVAHSGLKIRWERSRPGSKPGSPTKKQAPVVKLVVHTSLRN
jgi:hypothetical protein